MTETKQADGIVRDKFGEIVEATGMTEDALTRICDAHWNGGKGEGVVFLDIHQHNACNHTLSGTIDVGGVIYGFIIDNGDWNGTVVRSWGDPEDVGYYDPGPPPEPITFVPRDPDLHITRPAMFGVYIAWRKEPWFRELERSYSYDRHFAPGGNTERHYRDKADKRGLVPGYLSNLPPEAKASITKATQ